MNKRKLAVFVEGQTELVFVREFLKQWYGYDVNVVGFDCYNLRAKEFCDAEYKYGGEDSENYFMLVNVGNDNSVLSSIIGRLKFLREKDFQLVVGLRDMYSSQYVKDTKNHEIVDEVSQKHLDSVKEVLKNVEDSSFVDFHFAIMEVEAWFIGIEGFMERLDERLTPDFVHENLNINFDDDPEKMLFHPAAELGKIYALVGKQYNKHKSDISAIMSLLTNDDFLRLIHSGKCNTFKMFVESLLGQKF